MGDSSTEICYCPSGYTLLEDGITCQKISSVSATTYATYTAGLGSTNGLYGNQGGYFYEDITNLTWPLLVSGGSAFVSNTVYDSSSAITIVEEVILNSLWGGVGPFTGWRLNTVGLWTTVAPLPVNEWIGFAFCVDLPNEQTYTIGIAGDDLCRVKINGVLVLDFLGIGWSFVTWKMFPIKLNAGVNLIEMEGFNTGGPATFGAEIYSTTTNILSGITTSVDLEDYIVFSTKDYIDQEWQIGQSSGYVCASGYSLNTCSESYVCSSIEKTNQTCEEIVTVQPRNECDVLTIFPMEVDCLVTHPSTTKSFDGVATLIITGGTSPYTITWSTGSIAPLIYNLNVGSYNATVVDFYGDYTANTTCVLTAITPTTTTTTTLPPLPTYGNLCMIISVRKFDGKTNVVNLVRIQFEPNTITNGKQNWLSQDEDYFIYWNTGSTNQWVLSASTPSTGAVVNNNPSTPPITGWQALGNPSIVNISTVSGDCNDNKEITLNVTKNDYVCELKGSINIQAYGGEPPYTYSINNGLTFSTTSVFTNLNAGQYLIVVKDSLGNTTNPQNIIITQVQPDNYNLTLTVNETNRTFQIQASSNLPTNETITFRLAQTSFLRYYPSTLTPTPIYTNTVTFNGGLGTMDNQSVTYNQNVLSLGCSNTPVTENQQSISYTKELTIGSGQIISGTYTDILTFAPNGECESASKSFILYLLNDYELSNCTCCNVKIINPPQVSLTRGNIVA